MNSPSDWTILRVLPAIPGAPPKSGLDTILLILEMFGKW